MNEEDKLRLKVQAFRERITELTDAYENKVADLRVEITVVTQERDAAQSTVAGLVAERDNNVPEETSESNED